MMGKMKPEWVSLSLVLAMAGGIALADALSLSFGLWISLFLLSLLGIFFSRPRSRLGLAVCLVLAALSLGAGRLQLEADRYEALPHQAAGARLTVEGMLQERRSTYTNEKGWVGRYIMQVRRYAYDGEADVQPGKGCIYVTLPEPQVIGSIVAVTGDSRPLTYYKNAGMYDALHRDREKAICLRLFADDGKKVTVTAPPGRWEAFLQDLRQALTGRYEAILGDEYAPVLASLLFGGHYEDLPPGLLESFSTTGLIHILSVSGSHVALLLAVIQLMGRALGLRPRGLFCISVVFLFLYGALSDFSSPVVRASLMGAASALSLTARREYLAGHALALAMAGMLLYSPYLFFDLSFRLSCGASAGIILFQQPVSQWFSGLPVFLQDCLTVCVAAQILVVPLLFSAFFSFPVYSLVANVLVAPVLDLVMVLGLLASVLSLLWAGGADMVLWLIKPLLALALKGNAFIAALPGSRFWAGQPSKWACLAWYLAVAFVFCPTVRRHIVPVWLACLAVAWFLRPSGSGVLVLDAGRDQVTAVIHEDKSADIWYNKSRFANPNQAAVVVTPALRAHGVFRLRQCRVDGDGADHTLALLRRDFTFLSGKGSGDVPFRCMASVPPVFPAEPLCLEFRSLTGWNGRDFPVSAMATIVYGSRRGDEVLSEWGETAAGYGVPCFSPSRDGQVRLYYWRGQWRISTFDEEQSWNIRNI